MLSSGVKKYEIDLYQSKADTLSMAHICTGHRFHLWVAASGYAHPKG